MISWPWHVKVIRADGTVTEDNYANDFNALGFARRISSEAAVERVEVSVTFADGEEVAREVTP